MSVAEKARKTDVFAISEKPVTLSAWSAEEEADRSGALEEQCRSLMRRVAESEYALENADKDRRKGLEKILLEILEVLDAFERVFRSVQSKPDEVTPQMKKWVGNFKTIFRLLQGIASAQGVVRIENLEAGFDPHWHKIVETVEDASRPDGAVVEEVRAGYLWKDRVIRKADLVVVRNESEMPQEETRYD
jgi:molecular chaperone GrpE